MSLSAYLLRLRQQNFLRIRNCEIANYQIDQQRDGAGTVDKKFKHPFCRGIIIDDNG